MWQHLQIRKRSTMAGYWRRFSTKRNQAALQQVLLMLFAWKSNIYFSAGRLASQHLKCEIGICDTSSFNCLEIYVCWISQFLLVYWFINDESSQYSIKCPNRVPCPQNTSVLEPIKWKDLQKPSHYIKLPIKRKCQVDSRSIFKLTKFNKCRDDWRLCRWRLVNMRFQIDKSDPGDCFMQWPDTCLSNRRRCVALSLIKETRHSEMWLVCFSLSLDCTHRWQWLVSN